MENSGLTSDPDAEVPPWEQFIKDLIAILARNGIQVPDMELFSQTVFDVQVLLDAPDAPALYPFHKAMVDAWLALLHLDGQEWGEISARLKPTDPAAGSDRLWDLVQVATNAVRELAHLSLSTDPVGHRPVSPSKERVYAAVGVLCYFWRRYLDGEGKLPSANFTKGRPGNRSSMFVDTIIRSSLGPRRLSDASQVRRAMESVTTGAGAKTSD